MHIEDIDGPTICISAIAATLPISSDEVSIFDTSQPVPLERWDIEDVQKASTVAHEARFGCFLANADVFDAVAFSISRYFRNKPPLVLLDLHVHG